jgi:Zn-dependent M28 family amino/carboxypeptidase
MRLQRCGRGVAAAGLLAVLLAAPPAAVSYVDAAPRTPGASAFDSGRAFEDIRQLVAIGPRPAGSPGSVQARAYISKQLEAAGLRPREQAFTATTPFGPKKMANVIAAIPGSSRQRIVLGGHYDTKLFRDFRFVGANDGGSSTAMLLELARVLAKRKGPFTIELVFFDGEEAMLPEWSGTDNTYGSRHYVEEAKKSGTLKDVRAMLLVDMVGDRDLNIRREAHSSNWLTEIIWASARALGHGEYFLNESEPIEDDHVNFLKAGVPSVDLIDLDYRAWHTPEDTIERVSARSLQVVGDVIIHALPKIDERLKK